MQYSAHSEINVLFNIGAQTIDQVLVLDHK